MTLYKLSAARKTKRTKAQIEKMLSSRKEKAAARLGEEFERGYEAGRQEVLESRGEAMRAVHLDSSKAKAHAMEALAKVADACAQIATSISQMSIDGRME